MNAELKQGWTIQNEVWVNKVQTFVYNSILLTGLEFNSTMKDFFCPWHWLLIDFKFLKIVWKSLYCSCLFNCHISCSGFAVGIYSTNSPEACHYVADDSEANICVVENDAQLQKILQVRDRLPHLRAIIQYRGQLSKRYPNVYTVSIMSDEWEILML